MIWSGSTRLISPTLQQSHRAICSHRHGKSVRSGSTVPGIRTRRWSMPRLCRIPIQVGLATTLSTAKPIQYGCHRSTAWTFVSASRSSISVGDGEFSLSCSMRIIARMCWMSITTGITRRSRTSTSCRYFRMWG